MIYLLSFGQPRYDVLVYTKNCVVLKDHMIVRNMLIGYPWVNLDTSRLLWMWSCVCFTGFDVAGGSSNSNETHFSSNRVRARHAGDQNVVDMMKVKKFHNPKLYQHVDQKVFYLIEQP